jgi:hypothetical protein
MSKQQTVDGAKRLAAQIKASKIELRPLHDLMPYARNSRKHEDWQVAKIAGSIREFGFTNPILIDDAGTIVAGHARVMAALKLDLTEVPCIVLRHLTETQRKAYVIADNQLAALSTWDVNMMALELQELSAADFDMPILGFGELEMSGFLNQQDTGDLGGGEGGGTVDASGAGATDPTSHVRMVQLFLDASTQPEFLSRCDFLQDKFGTNTLTDTIVKAVAFAFEAHDEQPE